MGVVLRTHSVRGEPRKASGEVQQLHVSVRQCVPPMGLIFYFLLRVSCLP